MYDSGADWLTGVSWECCLWWMRLVVELGRAEDRCGNVLPHVWPCDVHHIMERDAFPRSLCETTEEFNTRSRVVDILM